MIDEHALDTIKAEAERWRLEAPARGTRREYGVYCSWLAHDSTRIEAVAVYRREATDAASVTYTVRFAADEPITPGTIRARLDAPFGEAGR